MKRLLITALIIGAVLGALWPSPTGADHQDYFCGYAWSPGGCLDTSNPAITELRDYGVHRWAYVQEAGGNMLPAIAQCLAEVSGEFGVYMAYDPNGYRQIASGGMAFIYGTSLHGPGGTWAIGFVDSFPGDPRIVYDAFTMAAWPQRSQIEVCLHETLHVLVNAAEGYKEDYVYGAGVNTCGGSSAHNLSIMGCGLTNAQRIGNFERSLWLRGHFPSPVNSAALQGSRSVWWAFTNYKARLVAVIATFPSGDRGLVAVGKACQGGGDVCWGVALPVLPSGTLIHVKAQNALYAPESNEVFAGVVP